MIRRCARRRSGPRLLRHLGAGDRRRWGSTRSSPDTATPSPSTCRRCGGAATSTAPSTSSSHARRDHYLAWQRERLVAMLHEADVHPGEHEAILADLQEGRAVRVLEAYDEVPGVLASCATVASRSRSARTGTGTSNRRWPSAGSTAGSTRSCRRRGRARGSRTRGSTATCWSRRASTPRRSSSSATRGVPTWRDPLAAGMTPVYLERDGHWPDATRPADTSGVSVHRVARPARCAPAGGSGLNACQVEGCVRRRGRSGLPRPCGRGRRRTRRADPLPRCGSPSPGWPRSGRTRRGRPHGR